MESNVPHPEVIARAEWLATRKPLLVAEKELTRHYDRVNAERRRLPMVKLEKQYTFEGAGGQRSLVDLFDGARQLIVYHFISIRPGPGLSRMYPAGQLVGRLVLARGAKHPIRADCACSAGETGAISAAARLESAVVFVVWHGLQLRLPRHAGQGRNSTAIQLSFASRSGRATNGRTGIFTRGEAHGLSVFFRLDGAAYHTYSTYARGCESLTDAYRLLDLTPYGRQEDFEDSPAGWPQKPTYGS